MLLLDEPTAGLDPLVRSELLSVLNEVVRDDGASVLFSTHNFADISRNADEIVVLHAGRIAHQAIVEDLTETWRALTFHHDGPLPEFPGLRRRCRGNDYVATTEDPEALAATLTRIGVVDIQSHRLGIEDIAIEIMRRTRRDSL